MPRPQRFPKRICTHVTEEEYAALLQEANDGGFDGIAALLRDILTKRRMHLVAAVLCSQAPQEPTQ